MEKRQHFLYEIEYYNVTLYRSKRFYRQIPAMIKNFEKSNAYFFKFEVFFYLLGNINYVCTNRCKIELNHSE